MNNFETIISQINQQIGILDKKISKIYIFPEEINKEEIEAFFTDLELLRSNLQSLHRELNKIMNRGNLSYITHCTKSINLMDYSLNELNTLLYSKNYKDFHSCWHGVIQHSFLVDIKPDLDIIKFITDMQVKEVYLFTFHLEINTWQLDYSSLTDDLSSHSDTYLEIRDSGACFLDGGALLIATVIATTANLLVMADILHDWTKKKKEKKHPEEYSGLRNEGTSIKIISKRIDVNIENLSKEEIVEILKESLQDNEK